MKGLVLPVGLRSTLDGMMHRPRSTSLVPRPALALLLGLALLAGPATAQEAEEPAESPSEFVVAAFPTDVEFNPIRTYTAFEAQVYTAVYEGLVGYHPLTLEPVPGVARTWTVSNDNLRWTFRLRPDARYSNGDRVTAAHFRDTWLALLHPDADSAYSFLFDVIRGAQDYRLGRNSDPGSVGIRAVSDSELVVELHSPATHFLDILCHHSFVVVHPDMLEKGDWDSTEIIGNGPFVLTERSEDRLVMEVNEQYWDRDALEIDGLRILLVDDPETSTEAFNRGSVHWMSGGWNLEAITDRRSIVVNPMFSTTYYYFRASEKPYDDARVRRALALLLPWSQIRSEEIYFSPASTLVPPIPFYPNPDGIVEAVEDEALALLAEAGYPGGNGLPAPTILIPGGEDHNRIATLVQAAWGERLNLEVQIVEVPFPRYFDALETESYTLGTVSWIGDFADPLTFLQMWTSGSNLNDSGYANADFDGLVNRSLSQRGSERFQTLAEAEAMLLDSGLVLPISHSPAVNVIDQRRISGWYANPLDIHPFKHIGFAELAPIPRVAGSRGD